MTAQTRERLVNALISICICIIVSLFVLYASKDYTRSEIEIHEEIEINSVCNKIDELIMELDSVSIQLDEMNSNN